MSRKRRSSLDIVMDMEIRQFRGSDCNDWRQEVSKDSNQLPIKRKAHLFEDT